MKSAISAAISWTAPPGAAPPSTEMVSAALSSAAELLRAPAAEDKEGLQALENLTLAMGLPATRAMFRSMVQVADLRGSALAAAEKHIAEISPVTEVGCMKVDFFNQTTQAPDVAYLVLDRCPRHHNLGAELNKLEVHVSSDKWPEILRSLSSLVHIGRTVYSQAARKNHNLIKQIFGASADDARWNGTQYLDLQVDHKNTTLFIEPDWPDRIGIYIRLGADVLHA